MTGWSASYASARRLVRNSCEACLYVFEISDETFLEGLKDDEEEERYWELDCESGPIDMMARGHWDFECVLEAMNASTMDRSRSGIVNVNVKSKSSSREDKKGKERLGGGNNGVGVATSAGGFADQTS